MLRILAIVTCIATLAACGMQEASVEGELSSCPQLVEPGPHFCPDGTIIVVKDAHGCNDWACDRGAAGSAAPTVTPPSCPIPVYPGEQFCPDGTIVVVKDENGCSYYACKR